MDDRDNLKKKGRLREGKYIIPFTNTAIDNLKQKSKLAKGKYIKVRFKDQRGIYLYWSPKKLKKKFYQRYKFNGKDYDLDLGEYIKGTYGCDEALSKLLKIYEKHKEKGKWKTNPREEYLTNDELVDSQKLTIRKVIEKLLEYNFPLKNMEGRLASTTAFQFSLFLIGYNKRRKQLEFKDDEKGMCTIKLKGFKSWKDFWEKYPSGKGAYADGEQSLYDNKLSSIVIDELTPGKVERYLEERQRSYGTKRNILKALQCLWGFARNTLKAFGDKRPTDPTSMKEGGVELKKPIESKFAGSKYNETSLDAEQFKQFKEELEKEKKKRPYVGLAIELLPNIDIRITENQKLKKSDIKADHILLRKETRKLRSKGVKITHKKLPITDTVRAILNQIKETDKKHPQYKFVPWLFPSPRINLEKLNEPGYPQKDECRLRDLSETFDLIRQNLDFECSLKTLRKTYLTEQIEAEKELGKTEEEAIEEVSKTSHPRNPQTLKKSYYKPSFDRQLKRANKISKVIQMKRKS